MREIPEDIVDIVNKITDELVVYKNEKGLSWTSAYKDVLDTLDMGDKKNDDRILTNVVTKITQLGYDIEDKPFKLNRFL